MSFKSLANLYQSKLLINVVLFRENHSKARQFGGYFA
jgi:hypothetical protein